LVIAPPSSTARSTSICASVASLISLIDAPPFPRIRATDRVGTVNLRTLLDSFSNSTAYSNHVKHVNNKDGNETHIHQFRFCASNALLATLDEHFVRFELFPRFSLSVLSRLTRECDLDGILLFEPYRVFTILTDERRMILARDLKDFRGFISLRKVHTIISVKIQKLHYERDLQVFPVDSRFASSPLQHFPFVR
jgi:hypothetical protein